MVPKSLSALLRVSGSYPVLCITSAPMAARLTNIFRSRAPRQKAALRFPLSQGVSSTTGRPMTTKNLGALISKITLETIGVDVSPHLFRTAAASTAAAYGGNTPHLASALLNHTDPRVTEEHVVPIFASRWPGRIESSSRWDTRASAGIV
jgi:hypothetical protein